MNCLRVTWWKHFLLLVCLSIHYIWKSLFTSWHENVNHVSNMKSKWRKNCMKKVTQWFPERKVIKLILSWHHIKHCYTHFTVNYLFWILSPSLLPLMFHFYQAFIIFQINFTALPCLACPSLVYWIFQSCTCLICNHSRDEVSPPRIWTTDLRAKALNNCRSNPQGHGALLSFQLFTGCLFLLYSFF